jgi:hypothetical protein
MRIAILDAFEDNHLLENSLKKILNKNGQTYDYFKLKDMNIERCAGFYIYDKTGTKLRIKPTEPAEDREEKNTSGWILKMAVVMLSIVTIIMFMIIVNMKNEINVINEKLKSYEQNMEIFNDIQNAIMNQVGPQDSGGAQTNSQSGNSK